MSDFTQQSISNLRSVLLIRQPFFGSLAMRLRMGIGEVIVSGNEIIDNPTACTDGENVIFNPKFMATLTSQEQTGVMVHEILHCALTHMFRREGRDPERWNHACDYVINPIILKDGFKLPKDVLLNQAYAGLSAEAVYSKLQANQSKQKQGKGQGNGSPGNGKPQSGKPQAGDGVPTGKFIDPQSGTDKDGQRRMTATDWKIAVEQAAAVAKACGNLPGGIMEEIIAERKTTTPWRAILQQFIVNTIQTEVSWARPSRRYVHQGMYFPGPVKSNVGPIVVAIDTSGSVSTEMLKEFAAEITEILHTANPEKIVVIYCDTSIQGTVEFTPDDTNVVLQMKGRGGTAFNPVFRYLQQKSIDPVAILYLTDLENGGEQVIQPDVPVLWATPAWVSKKQPYGELVRLQAS